MNPFDIYTKMPHYMVQQNILIAKKLGFHISDNDSIAWFPTGFFTFVNDAEFFKSCCSCSVSDLKFHSSWDWIMRAVDYIESIPEPMSLDINEGTCFPYGIVRATSRIKVVRDGRMLFSVDGNDIKSMHTAVIRFFEWYEKK